MLVPALMFSLVFVAAYFLSAYMTCGKFLRRHFFIGIIGTFVLAHSLFFKDQVGFGAIFTLFTMINCSSDDKSPMIPSIK